ncbi:MAG: ATP synthase subunit I [Desulfobacteraceae bacterium]
MRNEGRLELLSPRTLKLANWMALALLVIVGYLWQGPKFALGVLMGGLLVVFNFHWLHRNLKALLEGPARSTEEGRGQAKAFFAARQMLRFLVTLVVLYLLLRQDWVNAIGLVVGLSTTVLTLMAVAVIEVIKLKKKEANPSHGTPHSIS